MTKTFPNGMNYFKKSIMRQRRMNYDIQWWDGKKSIYKQAIMNRMPHYSNFKLVPRKINSWIKTVKVCNNRTRDV